MCTGEKMRITICHLSDIHFSKSENSVIEKTLNLVNAILENALREEEIIFLITGDIASSGKQEEYYVALDFFLRIRDKLKAEKNITSYFFFTPGNHDCDFSNEGLNFDDEIRRERSFSQRNDLKDNEMLHFEESLCEKQNAYNEFVAMLNFGFDQEADKILVSKTALVWKYQININNYQININSLNSAWLSQKEEKPGKMFFPKKEYLRLIKKQGLNISMYHHPTNWMQPDERNNFHEWVMKQSDIVYVGHEHIGKNEYTVTRDTEYHTQYGEVLQDPLDNQQSSFIINYIENTSFQTHVYIWNKELELYKNEKQFNKNFTEVVYKNANYLPEYINYLNSFDMQIYHPKISKIQLKDLFIYPDIEVYNEKMDVLDRTKDAITIKGERLISFILDNKRVAFSGKSKTGKTAIAKSIAIDMMENDKLSIIIDCKNLTSVLEKNIVLIEEREIIRAYGKNKLDFYKQLPMDKKILLLDNLDRIKSENNRKILLEYFDNFYEYIITFSSTKYELKILEDTFRKYRVEFIQCGICELGHKKRNKLIKKWYSLSERDDLSTDEDKKNKIDEATETINTLRGSGYMPCIPPHVLIILQQLDYETEKNQDRSNYGNMYEFLIKKSILEMKKRNQHIHDDIATGILITVASYMLENNNKFITKQEFFNLVKGYNELYTTDANAINYLSEFEKSELLENDNEQIQFVYSYIHYYFTAKYLEINIQEEWCRKKVVEMAHNLFDEESGDIMIFLCHLSKDTFIIQSLLDNAKSLFKDIKEFSFTTHKQIKISFDEYIDTNIVPELYIEERKDKLLDEKDKFEEKSIIKKKGKIKNPDSSHESEKMQELDNAFKTIEVMGQILKNYPGSIIGVTKNELLNNIHNLGMRTLTFTSDILYGAIEKLFDNLLENNVEEEFQEYNSINVEQVESDNKAFIEKINEHMDNLFGMLTYGMLRQLSNSISNQALKVLINNSVLEKELSYELTKFSLYLNEFGIIQSDVILSRYDKLIKEDRLFAAKLLRLMVFEHYYRFGSTDYKKRQMIWDKMNFNEMQKTLALVSNAK